MISGDHILFGIWGLRTWALGAFLLVWVWGDKHANEREFSRTYQLPLKVAQVCHLPVSRRSRGRGCFDVVRFSLNASYHSLKQETLRAMTVI